MEENTNIPKVRSSFFKKILKSLLWLFVIILLLAGSLLTLLFVYEDEVKAEIVKELNRHLNAEVKIDPKNIDLTILKTFPDCSIEFKEVLMYEALKLKQRDTLLYAERLNLYFNIEDLWNKKYIIEKIKLKDALVKLRILKDGQNNFSFWKADTNTAQSKDSLDFHLKLITIENCRLSYKDKPSDFKTLVQLDQVKFKGHFGDSNFEMETQIKGLIHDLTIDKVGYLKEKQCELSLSLNVNENNYQLKNAKVKLSKMLFVINGSFDVGEQLERMSLTYKAPELEIGSFLSLLPLEFKKHINDYESKGNFYAEGNLRYSLKNGYSSINDFGITGGKITYKPGATSAENVNIIGHLELTDKTSLLQLKDIHLNLNSDEIKGNCSISNFSDPELSITTSAVLNLENLQSFWPIDTVSHLKGGLQVVGELKGLLRNIKSNALSENVIVNFDAKLSNIEVQFKQDEKNYKAESGSINVREREVLVNELKLKRGQSDMIVSGKIPGLFKYLLDRTSPLAIIGSLKSDYILLEDFMMPASKSSASNDNDLIPENVTFNLEATISKFNLGKFEAKSLMGEIEIRNQKMIVSDMRFTTMQGEAVFQAYVDNSRKKLEVVLQSRLTNINITDLFSQMNNFGQSTLTESNLRGVGTATIDFSGIWNNRLEIDSRSIQSLGNIMITGGELLDFKPLLSLSKFVDVNDLKRIKFSSMQSNIEINNQTITIPKTAIKNSALNLDLSGTHTFDNEINYHIQLLISELLAKKRQKKDDEFGPVEKENNKRSAFISMTGTVDNPIIKYDREGLKEKIRSDLKQEKQSIKELLKEEFGLFKKDTTVQKPKREETNFQLEKSNNTPVNKPLEPKKKKEEDEDF